MRRDTLLDFFDDRIRSDSPFLHYDDGYRTYTHTYREVRQAADGRIGCMGSLGLEVEALPDTPKGQQPLLVEQFLRQPVPCVAALGEQVAELAAFVRRDIERRRRVRQE